MTIVRSVICVILFSAGSQHLEGQSLGGHWDGAITIGTMNLGIMLDLRAAGDSLTGTIDIPQQLALGLRLRNVSQRGTAVHFELPAGPGLAIFDGALRRDTLAGTFKQGSASGTFLVVRGKAADTAQAEAPPPYRQEEVTFRSGALTLAGTLTLPAGARGPVPAIVLLTGSGAQNRDEELFGFRPFRLIADQLTRQGMAVLRFDDRGVGGSGGSMEQVTTEDFASDALAAASYLGSRKEIDHSRIGLLGHSEGALAAVIAARRSAEVRFVVLVAGPAVRGDRLLLAQIEGLARQQGATQSQVNDALFIEQRVFDVLRTNTGWEELREQMRSQAHESLGMLSAEQRKGLGNVDSLVNVRVDAQLTAVKSPWFRFFVQYDPVPDLRALRIPVLALFGEKDMQVPPSINEQPMRDALGGGTEQFRSVRVIPGANHLFQTAVTGSPTEYATLKKAFVPGLLTILSDWLQKAVRTGG